MMTAAKMQLTDWLDDLSVRFIVNLPREELESVERICFQVEEAQWFYEDFVRPLNPNLPSLSLRQFSMKIFQHCPLFSGYGADVHSKAFAEFLAYKTRVPVRGAILLNEALDQVILVKGWKKGSNWSFPRGKINKDERDIDCAIREVYEETGFDIRAAGLVGDEEIAKFIEVTMREQHMKLFVFAGVPMSTHFEPRTRKEISKIQWYKLSELPTLKRAKQQQHGLPDINNSNKFYMVAPFLSPLRKIIIAIKKERASHYEPAQVAEPSIHRNHPVPNSLSSDSIVSSDLQRLMNQLRQSKQASRETNFPEVSVPADNSHMASVQLRKLLSLSPGDQAITCTNDEGLPSRESKANAMLSILWGHSQGKDFVQQQTMSLQTPFEQIPEHSKKPPRSPKHSHNVARPALAFNSQPQQYRLPPPSEPQSSTASTAQLIMNDSTTSQLPYEPMPLRQPNSTSVRPVNPEKGMSDSQISARAPYQQIGDTGRAYGSYPFQDVPAVPPASRLPPPKLTKHSSTLLNLFKNSRKENMDSSLESAVNPPRQELSVRSPATTTTSSQLMEKKENHKTTSSNLSLLNPSLVESTEPTIARPQQETLLSLFRQSSTKPSPSLIPPDNPIELSAQGSPTHSRVSSDIPQEKQNMKGSDQRITIRRTGFPPKTTTSATVTGPLNEPQFERILRKSQVTTMDSTIQTSQVQNQQIRILSRPSSTEEAQWSSNSPQEQQYKSSESPIASNTRKKESGLSFRPQILKRSDPLHQPVNQSPRSKPIPTPVAATAIARAPVKEYDMSKQSDQPHEQNSNLFSLFGKSKETGKSPSLARTGSIVSPLSEKPLAESELPSPIGLGRSRYENLQEGLGGSGLDSSRISGTSAGDKKFLLGFLDGVVKKGT